MILIFISFLSLLLLVLFYSYVYFWRKNTKFMKNVPGPKANLFFGNVGRLLVIPKYGYLQVMEEFVAAHGGIFKLYDGPLSTLIVVTDVKFTEFILSSMKFLDKADQYNNFHSWLGTGLLTSTGTKWKNRRRMLTPAFHFSILENFADIFENVGEIFMEILENKVGQKSVNIQPLVSLYTLDVICEAAMGTKLNAQRNGSREYVNGVKTMLGIVADRITSPFHPKLYPLTLNCYLEKWTLKRLHAHTDGIIEKRIAENMYSNKEGAKVDSLGRKKRLAFLDLLLESTIDGKPLSRLDIREEVDTFMFEGQDTTSAAISFALYSLAMNPHVQEKACQEQQEIFGTFKGVKPTVAQLQQMKYLELVIKETLRLYPSVPFIARKFPEDVEYEGNIYPKGQNLTIFAYGVHRDPKKFPNPLEFIPERFIDIDGTDPYTYIPFSAGPRNCIGQKFAMLEMKSTLSKVLRNFELLPSTPVHKLKLAPDTILVSKNGVCISLEKRKQ